jgi:NADH-quinone oxidoreductase subunit N
MIAAASMIWGNFVALLQDNLKRLLAYSSIAHAGYLMVGVAASFVEDRRFAMVGVAANFVDDRSFTGLYGGSESVLFYLVTYALMTLGLFGGFIALRLKDRPVETVADLAGLGWTQPWPALALAVCLLSLSGIPPLLGFWGKLEIFGAALAAGERTGSGAFLMLAVIGMLSAAAGAYYYLRIVVVMYFGSATEPATVWGGWPVSAAVITCASLTVILGLVTTPLTGAARAAARAALAHPAPLGIEAASAGPANVAPAVRLVHD